MAALKITNLRKSYGANSVVNGLSLTALRGQVTSVLGPNGAGKTTTIECCEGLRTPDSGEIEILGHLRPGSPQARSSVGVMLQDGGLPSSVRALDMLRHVSRLYADPWDVDELVALLGIESFGSTTVRRLSGGQRQRLSLAAALVGRPALVFLDEPSAGMDPQSRHAVWQLIRSLRDRGSAVVLTTHLMDEAEALSNQVYIVDHGAVIASGSPAELTQSGENAVTIVTSDPLDPTQLAHALTPAGQDTYAISSISSRAGTSGAANGHSYRIRAAVSPELITNLATWLAAQHNTLLTLNSGQSTLEDVFLNLTGRTLR